MLVKQHPCALRGVLGEYKLGVLKAEQDVRNGSVSAASSPVAYGLAGGKARERDGPLNLWDAGLVAQSNIGPTPLCRPRLRIQNVYKCGTGSLSRTRPMVEIGIVLEMKQNASWPSQWRRGLAIRHQTINPCSAWILGR